MIRLNGNILSKEVDKLIDYIKEAISKEENEYKVFNLSVLRYFLARHKVSFGKRNNKSFIRHLLSDDNVALLKQFGWTVLTRTEPDYDPTEYYCGDIEYRLLPPGENIEQFLNQQPSKCDFEDEDYDEEETRWRVLEKYYEDDDYY